MEKQLLLSVVIDLLPRLIHLLMLLLLVVDSYLSTVIKPLTLK